MYGQLVLAQRDDEVDERGAVVEEEVHELDGRDRLLRQPMKLWPYIVMACIVIAYVVTALYSYGLYCS